jgi:hypothetical protein
LLSKAWCFLHQQKNQKQDGDRDTERDKEREREIERETEREFFVPTICGAIVDTDNFIGCSTPPHDCSHSLHKGSDAANFVEHRDDDGN